jgi:hypothetical protein
MYNIYNNDFLRKPKLTSKKQKRINQYKSG